MNKAYLGFFLICLIVSFEIHICVVKLPSTTIRKEIKDMSASLNQWRNQLTDNLTRLRIRFGSKSVEDITKFEIDRNLFLSSIESKINDLKEYATQMEDSVELTRSQVESDIERARELETKTKGITKKDGRAFLALQSTVGLKKKKKLVIQSNSDVLQANNLGRTCLNAYFNSVPPSFCWKSGGDAGYIPTLCPSGWFRSGALCYQNCITASPVYRFVAGVCWQDCPSGYSDWGLTCASWFGFINKNSYIDSSMTNYDSRVLCNSGDYKVEALCSRDCAKALMVNCGIGACSANSDSCISSIVSMAVSVIVGIVQAAVFFTSFGSSSAESGTMSETIMSFIYKIGDKAKAVFNNVKAIATNTTSRSLFVEKVKSWALTKLKDAALSEVDTQIVKATCGALGNAILDKLIAQDDPTYQFSQIASGGFNDVGTYCTVGSSTYDKTLCAKAAVTIISNYDPTGLSVIAAALVNPTCVDV